MAYWQNWSGRQSGKVKAVHFGRSYADIQALVAELAQSGEHLRVAGAGHSHAPLVVGADRVLDISGLAGVISTDSDRMTARICAGTPIFALGAALHQSGMALKNQGDIDRQILAGACATGTHGSGRYLQNLSASIESMTLIDGHGELRHCSRATEGEAFDALKVGLGAFGVVVEIEMGLRPAFKLQEQGFEIDGNELTESLADLESAHERFEFFWQPRQDKALVKTMIETDAAPEYPIADEGSRCAWNYEVLPNHRPRLHTEMEYSISASAGPACFEEIRLLLMTEFTDVQWPVEYRTLAADKTWLSNAYERDTVTISVHQDVNEDETEYYRACEEIFDRYQGRPHWGKVHYLKADKLAARYPKWEDWWAERNRFDPQGIFLNEFLQSVQIQT
ncbi:MAG: FAD-binding protein [Pseudomonadales bacterium]|nr:FAD-binding protein [Pseudomonadales bacterium]